MLPETAGIKPLRDFDISLEAFLILRDIYDSNFACGTENFLSTDSSAVRLKLIPILSDRILILCPVSDFG